MTYLLKSIWREKDKNIINHKKTILYAKVQGLRNRRKKGYDNGRLYNEVGIKNDVAYRFRYA